jgi:hypothetical protein
MAGAEGSAAEQVIRTSHEQPAEDVLGGICVMRHLRSRRQRSVHDDDRGAALQVQPTDHAGRQVGRMVPGDPEFGGQDSAVRTSWRCVRPLAEWSPEVGRAENNRGNASSDRCVSSIYTVGTAVSVSAPMLGQVEVKSGKLL